MNFNAQQIEGLLVTALEGGSNYWYDLPDLSMLSREKGQTLVDAILKYLKETPDGKVPVYDAETMEEGETYPVNFNQWEDIVDAKLVDKPYIMLKATVLEYPKITAEKTVYQTYRNPVLKKHWCYGIIVHGDLNKIGEEAEAIYKLGFSMYYVGINSNFSNEEEFKKEFTLYMTNNFNK